MISDNSLLHHKARHDVWDVIDENISTAMNDVKSDCPFNELGYWHVTNNLIVDVRHDLVEDENFEECYDGFRQDKAKINVQKVPDESAVDWIFGEDGNEDTAHTHKRATQETEAGRKKGTDPQDLTLSYITSQETLLCLGSDSPRHSVRKCRFI
ncbi:hypothetical protein NPIL_379221 [Nephila pilipes]|uniref:Uncharacterized protein n=1 Tax=Nephila pilipes TaxID=299642 RepID=A0A8X6MYW6_NEPPI|nr:hypothetical protein NPIL_379221 [Nephila pilipes]